MGALDTMTRLMIYKNWSKNVWRCVSHPCLTRPVNDFLTPHMHMHMHMHTRIAIRTCTRIHTDVYIFLALYTFSTKFLYGIYALSCEVK